MQKTDILRFKTDTEKLWGIYRGVVEDNIDPLRLGRVRVRIMGVHTEEQAGELNKVPWEELQWSQPVTGIFEGSVSGSGAFTVPVQGSHVMLFFENGNMMQPRHFGTVPGFPIDAAKYSQLEKQDGYVDPAGWYPLDDHLVEQDWHRLNRVDKLGETYLAIKEEFLDLAVPYAFGGIWDEQPPMYAAEYPENNVFATHDDFKENIVVELDSTFGKERFAWWHPSRSYMEVNFEGRMTFRNTYHRWDICDGIVHTHYKVHHFKTVSDSMVFLIEKDEFREIKGNRWTKIWGASDWRKVYGNVYDWTRGATVYLGEGDTDSTILGNVNEWIEGYKNSHIVGSMKRWIHGNEYRVVEGKLIDIVHLSSESYVGGEYDKLYVIGDKLTHVDGNNSKMCIGDYIIQSGTYSINSAGALFLHSAGGINLQSSTDIGIKATNAITLYAGTINLGDVPIDNINPVEATPVLIKPLGEELPPVEPPDSPAPPAPDIPPEFVPPDEPVEMPEPAC